MRISNDKYTNISVEVTKSFNEELKERAKKAHVSKSEYIRNILASYKKADDTND